MTDEPKKRTPAAMEADLRETAHGLGHSAQRMGLPTGPAVVAGYETGLRMGLEIAHLDPEAGLALLEELKRGDISGADMAESARETVYDIPVTYLTPEEVTAEEDKFRQNERARKSIRPTGPATHSWHN